MKNKEKYYEEILEAFAIYETCEFKTAHIFKTNNCDGVTCLQCIEKTRQWLEAEYVEPIRLTRNEKAILESLPKMWKWIAKDECGTLCIFDTKPYKDSNHNYWLDSQNDCDITLFAKLFQFIKWSDEEPYSIEELLKCEVVDDE